MNGGVIGGVGLTRLQVYDQRPGPDGVHAGCAHVHALCDEAYYCIGGEGAVELHDLNQGFVRHPVCKGAFLKFPPGTLHRSVSYHGCEFLVIMGNSGLPERGDARIYFGPDVDADPEEYDRLKILSGQGIDGALARRDASAAAYSRLARLWETDRTAYRKELERFIDQHRRDIAERKELFECAIQEGSGAQLAICLERVQCLPGSSEAGVIQYAQTGAMQEVYGMCGVLRQIEFSPPGPSLAGGVVETGDRP